MKLSVAVAVLLLESSSQAFRPVNIYQQPNLHQHHKSTVGPLKIFNNYLESLSSAENKGISSSYEYESPVDSGIYNERSQFGNDAMSQTQGTTTTVLTSQINGNGQLASDLNGGSPYSSWPSESFARSVPSDDVSANGGFQVQNGRQTTTDTFDASSVKVQMDGSSTSEIYPGMDIESSFSAKPTSTASKEDEEGQPLFQEYSLNYLASKILSMEVNKPGANYPFANGNKPAGNDKPLLDTKGMTGRIMKRIPVETQATGAGGSSTWEAFQRTEAAWSKLKAFEPFQYDTKAAGRVDANGNPPPPQFVTQDAAVGNPACWTKLRAQSLENKELDFDVVVCGGTLGIFYAAALQLKGHKVCLVEAGKLRGREQEWNLSMNELQELVKMGILTQDDVKAAVKTDFPGCRSGFKNQEVSPLFGGYFYNGIGYECFTEDVLNLGVSPAILIEQAAARFKENGGVLREQTKLEGVCISETFGSAIDLGDKQDPITSRLVLDCMGNASPISRQQRHGMKPDGVCAVVGSCAAGFDPKTNLNGDLIYTNSKIEDKGPNGKLQYFWEAFPVGIGANGKEPGTSNVKTTYMFTYMDAHQDRPSLETLMEDYWKYLPIYQPSITNPETDLDVKRVLFAYFPTYRDSPLKPAWNRVLAVGDASGIQSPLSFGGFGALTRHLERISGAISEALEGDLLHKEELGAINAYIPNLSATWMFQKAMSVKMGQNVDPDFVNRLLAVNFEVMNKMGKRAIKPFLQDVVRFDGLVGSLARCFAVDPLFMPQIIAHVGIPRLVDWVGHVSMMGLYSVLDAVASPVLEVVTEEMTDKRERFQWRRRLEAWKFGSGRDYVLPKDN